MCIMLQKGMQRATINQYKWRSGMSTINGIQRNHAWVNVHVVENVFNE